MLERRYRRASVILFVFCYTILYYPDIQGTIQNNLVYWQGDQIENIVGENWSDCWPGGSSQEAREQSDSHSEPEWLHQSTVLTPGCNTTLPPQNFIINLCQGLTREKNPVVEVV